MRFYRSDGWTIELLNYYLKSGEFKFFDEVLLDYDVSYWILMPGSQLEVEKMDRDGIVGELRCRKQWGELKNMTDLEVLKYRNQ